MTFQFDTSQQHLRPPSAPQQPGDNTQELLRQLLEAQRDNTAQQRELLMQMLAVQQEQLNQARTAAADAQARWRNLLSRWQAQHPEFADQCRQAYPLLEKAYVGLLVGMVEEVAQQGEDALDTDFTVQEFLDRYGMRIGQLSHLLSVIGPLAEAAAQESNKQ
ncbi:MAG TPA: hypothetical protein VK898_13995 [Chloroflexota bacterium]|nr:hypothetical protein [Chloroflexota bacterium]